MAILEKQYAIPKDFENDSDESRLGRKYHDFAQKMLVNNNNIFGLDEPKKIGSTFRE